MAASAAAAAISPTVPSAVSRCRRTARRRRARPSSVAVARAKDLPRSEWALERTVSGRATGSRLARGCRCARGSGSRGQWSVGGCDASLMAEQLDGNLLEPAALERRLPPRGGLRMLPSSHGESRGVLEHAQDAWQPATADAAQLADENATVAARPRTQAKHHVGDNQAPSRTQDTIALGQRLSFLRLRHLMKAVVRHSEVRRGRQRAACSSPTRAPPARCQGPRSRPLPAGTPPSRANCRGPKPSAHSRRERVRAGRFRLQHRPPPRPRLAPPVRGPGRGPPADPPACQLLGIAHAPVPALATERHQQIIADVIRRFLEPRENPLICADKS